MVDYTYTALSRQGCLLYLITSDTCANRRQRSPIYLLIYETISRPDHPIHVTGRRNSLCAIFGDIICHEPSAFGAAINDIGIMAVPDAVGNTVFPSVSSYVV